MLYLLLFLMGTLSVLYIYLKHRYEFWARVGVPGPKPTWIIGNIGPSLIRKKTMGQIYADYYNEYKDLPFVGLYRALTPTLLIRDPALIKDITVRMFDHFHDNDFDIDEEADPIFGKNLFALKGRHWKIVRSQLIGIFSSSKMKSIFPLLNQVGQRMVRYVESENGPFDTKELSAKFTTDNIVTCAYGLEGKSFDNPKSEFRDIGRKLFSNPNTWDSMKLLSLFTFPSMSKIFKIAIIPKDLTTRLTTIVLKTLKYRKENNIVRHDFLHMLNEIKESCTAYKFSDMDIIGQAAGFFLDAFETSSDVMQFALFELASHEEVQNKLRKEIKECLSKNQEQLTYELVQDMSYLDAVLAETLRKHPPSYHMQKVCTKDYTFSSDDISSNFTKMSFVFAKGTSVVVSLLGLQMDPEYFPNPTEFIPERFLGEQRQKLVKYTYFPFGEGPRACIGQKFALLQIKVGICHLVNNFNLRVNEKTKVPIEVDTNTLFLAAKGGIWLHYDKLN